MHVSSGEGLEDSGDQTSANVGAQLRWLEPLSTVPSETSGPSLREHPMRVLSARVGRSEKLWSIRDAQRVRENFDALAPVWAERASAEREASLVDGLTRGRPGRGGTALEVGCGSGNHTQALSDYCNEVVSVDLSLEMLRHVAVERSNLVLCDASALPIRDSSVDLVVVVNMFLFSSEYRRVLRSDGYLLFVSSLAEQTPIYLSPQDVARSLGSEFSGVYSRAGSGLWSCFHRVDSD